MRAKLGVLPLIIALGFCRVPSAQAQVQVRPRETPQQQPSQRATQEQPGEVGKFSGPGSCAASNCHGGVQPKTVVRIAQNEYSIWAAQDKHARAYAVLSNPQSIRIGKILGLEQPPNKSDKCLDCHALNAKPELRAQTFQSIEDGVSCENCHGPAVGWLGPHTVKNWTHEQSLKLGMYDTRDVAKRTERCLTCHLGTGEKEVDHTMIAAGHPDLTFQLEAFSSAMPRHWKPAPNASPWLSVQELAVGQAVQLREALNRLSRRSFRANWPEYSEYECFACHHSLTKSDASWRQALGYHGRQPGAPVWNPATYAVFRHIATAADESDTSELLSQLATVEQLSGKAGSKEELTTHAKEASTLADRIAQKVQAQTYDRVLVTRLLQEIAGDSEVIASEGERSAEQAAMALDSLTVSYSANEKPANQAELRAAVNNLFQQLDNPSAYNAPQFAIQMQKIAALVPRGQPRASAGR
jgi:nitrate reductase cytochrome c-type subunit